MVQKPRRVPLWQDAAEGLRIAAIRTQRVRSLAQRHGRGCQEFEAAGIATEAVEAEAFQRSMAALACHRKGLIRVGAKRLPRVFEGPRKSSASAVLKCV